MRTLLTPHWIVILILIMLIGLPVMLYAGPKERFKHNRCVTREEMIELKNALNLTEEQEQALESLRNETRPAIQPLRAQAEELRYQFAETMLAEQIDTEKAEALIQQIVQVDSQIHDIKLHARLKGAQILSPPQRALVLERVQEIHKCRKIREDEPRMHPSLFFLFK